MITRLVKTCPFVDGWTNNDTDTQGNRQTKGQNLRDLHFHKQVITGRS